ncbi:response regulator transcription factor [Streptomyces griseoloalbus]|uniref:response regulator transcription factor n=1 Tax=Streptomyces griseoloalbus TaxID=67303 RepID=UPI003F5407CC
MGRRSAEGRWSRRELAAAGMSNREIAATLHLSPRTVEQHVARALQKTGVHSRQQLGRALRATPG